MFVPQKCQSLGPMGQVQSGKCWFQLSLGLVDLVQSDKCRTISDMDLKCLKVLDPWNRSSQTNVVEIDLIREICEFIMIGQILASKQSRTSGPGPVKEMWS